MDSEDAKQKMNDDLVVFMRKRSETEAPRYTARLKTYVDFQEKHRRAIAARQSYEKKLSNSKKRPEVDDQDKPIEDGPFSRPNSVDPEDGCCPKKKKKPSCPKKRRRRKSSCGKKKRRPSCPPKKKRSCSRRRKKKPKPPCCRPKPPPCCRPKPPPCCRPKPKCPKPKPKCPKCCCS